MNCHLGVIKIEWEIPLNFYEKLMRQLIRVLNFLIEEILCVLRQCDKETKRFQGKTFLLLYLRLKWLQLNFVAQANSECKGLQKNANLKFIIKSIKILKSSEASSCFRIF